MKHLVALFFALLTLSACNDKQQVVKSGTPLEQYVDSITAVYPNYKGNIAVIKVIGEDFEKRISTIPGLLEGQSFEVVGISEIGGKTNVMFACHEPSISLWCEDFGTEKAALLDKSKTYKVTGGTFDRYEPEKVIAHEWLDLGSIYVKDLTVEEN